MFIVQDC